MDSQLLIDDSSFTASGRVVMPQGGLATDRPPLIVAIHGGGFTSQYFDIPGSSLIERAAARGYGVLALDRLGHGRSRAEGKDVQSLAVNVAWLSEAIDRLWPQFREKCSSIVLIGHSIGSALVIMLAAQPQSWPVAGVAVSGAALTPNPELRGYFAQFPDDGWTDPTANDKDGLMLGRPDTIKDGIKALIHPAYVSVATRELLEINNLWPKQARAILKSLKVPVQFRVGEQEVLWVINNKEIEELSDLVSGVAGSSAVIVADAGHCIDFHKVGPKFQDDQLDFARACCR